MPFSRLARVRFTALLAAIAFAAGWLTGCGNSTVTGCSLCGTTPPLNTPVVLLITTTANDALVEFNISFVSLTLTNQSGTVVTVFSGTPFTGNSPEFIHLNGTTEPFATASIPDGTYTAATLTLGNCSFTNEYNSAGSLYTSTWDEGTCSEGTGTSTVTLPNPIHISGSGAVVSLNFQASQSYTLLNGGASTSTATYTIDPVFTLTPVTIGAAPTNIANGQANGISVEINSLNAGDSSFSATTQSGATFTVKSSASTVYQGLTGFSNLAASQIANIDLTIQPDASLVAARVEVDGPSAPYLNSGFSLLNYRTTDVEITTANVPLGCPSQTFYNCAGLYQYEQGTTYSVSGQFTNFSNLPFTPSFNASAWTAGQFVSADLVLGGGSQNEPVAQNIILEPQTVNGTVESVTNQNGVAVYTLVLAPYNLFAVMQASGDATQPAVTDPTTVTVYADQNTQFLNSGMVEEGQLLRFRGVVFNANGVLQMDCNEVLDGVTE